MVRILFDDIQYIKSARDYVHFYSEQGKVTGKKTIQALESELPENFVRVHRSFIVNTKLISAYTHSDIELGGKQIPIGSSYRKGVMEVLGG